MGIKDFLRKISKKDDVVVDLSDLQRRGIYHPRKDMHTDSNSEVLDLTSQNQGSSSENQSDGESALGFLGALAGASSPSSDVESTETLSTTATAFSYSERKQKLKGILRDMKEKLDSCYNKIYKLTERIEFLEKKIERLERRSGL